MGAHAASVRFSQMGYELVSFLLQFWSGDGVMANTLLLESMCEVRVLTAKGHSVSGLWR
jgi:hypothetical protein